MVEQQQRWYHHFDDFIIEEILTRLPIKSVLRFKSVSKQWYSTLSSSRFAMSHFTKSPSSHPSAPVDTLFIVSGYKNNYYLFSYDDDQLPCNFEDNLVKLDGTEIGKEDRFRLSGCCNGLVCLSQVHDEYFILWNPATRKVHKYVLGGDLYHFRTLEYFGLAHGFGHTSHTDDYKYVRIMRYLLTGQPCNNIVHIFSLRENKWREIEFNHEVRVHSHSHGVLIDEVLYWSVYCPGKGDRFTLSFDLRNETFHKVMSTRLCNIGNMGGYLSKCHAQCDRDYWGASKCDECDVSIQIIESSTTVKPIHFPKELGLSKTSQMIGFTRAHKFFVTRLIHNDAYDSNYIRVIGLVDTCIEPMQYSMLLKFDARTDIIRYVPSLVSPFPIDRELSDA